MEVVKGRDKMNVPLLNSTASGLVIGLHTRLGESRVWPGSVSVFFLRDQ